MAGEPSVGASHAPDIDRHRQREADEHGQCDADRSSDEVVGGESLAVDGHASYRICMCRSIKTLRRPGETATTGELEAAARQYVRKLSGFREPSSRNREAFDSAVIEITSATRRLVESVGVEVEDGPDRWRPGNTAARSRPGVVA